MVGELRVARGRPLHQVGTDAAAVDLRRPPCEDTAAASDVRGTIKGARVFDRRRVESVTSYDDPDVGEGNVVNQVEYEYNGWGRVAREHQEHDGAVDQYTPYVEYT